MINKVDLNSDKDYTFSSCVEAGDYVFTSHQGGRLDSDSFEVQLDACFQRLAKTLKAVDLTLDDVVKVNLLLKDIDDFRKTKDIFRKYFKNGFPARSTITTEFVTPKILVQIDAVAFKGEGGK